MPPSSSPARRDAAHDAHHAAHEEKHVLPSDDVFLPILPPFPTVGPSSSNEAAMMMATPRRIISWDTNTKQMRFTTPTPEGKSRKRTAGTFDSDGTHHHPPLEKKSDASNKVDDVSPLAATEMQPRARPRKSPLPSRVPAAAAVVQQTAQPSSPAIIAAPIEKYVSSSVNVSHDEHAHSSPWLPSTLPPPPPPLATMDGVRRRMGFVVRWGSSPYKGVCQRPTGKWGAQIKDPVAAKTLWLGTFDTAGEAARAYDCAARRIRKDNPRTNFDMPPGGDEPIPVSVLVALATVRPELRDAAEAAVQAA